MAATDCMESSNLITCPTCDHSVSQNRGNKRIICPKCGNYNHFENRCINLFLNNSNHSLLGFAPVLGVKSKDRHTVKSNSSQLKHPPSINLATTQNKVEISVKSKRTNALLDTGASITVASASFINKTSLARIFFYLLLTLSLKELLVLD